MSSWIPWGRKQQPSPPPLHPVEARVRNVYQEAKERMYATSPPKLALSAFVLGVVTKGVASRIRKRYFTRIQNSNWITPDYYQERRFIKGRVTTVGDADNFRLYHTPGSGWSVGGWKQVPELTKELRGETIHIRLAGVDAPEGAHFGFKAQPNYQESIDWLKEQVLGKTVYCQLLRRDQYGRSVAMVYLKPFFFPSIRRGRCVPIEMLKAGRALTYKESGAEYGDYSQEEFVQYEMEAEAARRGMFKNGRPKESPADWKRNAKNADVTEQRSELEITPTPEPQTGILKRIFGRFAKR